MRKFFWGKKLTSLVLAASLMVGSMTALSACGSNSDVIKLDVYSQLANYSGVQTGWFGDVMMDEFGVELNIIPDGDGVYETRMESGNLGDIVVWGNDYDRYPTAVQNGLLYDWEEDDLLHEYGPYIEENMATALQKNRNLTSTITNGESDTLYGFGHNVAMSSEDHDSFFYTWDIRWDLYKELGYPEVKDLDDYEQLLKDMVALCPTDDNGNKTYAVSLWPDWDDSMVMYVKAMATAYYGYDELELGLYDPNTGEYHGALEEDGPYLTMLKFFNNLYQDGLIDPDSMANTYDQMIEKVQAGGTMFSIFNYSGSLGYNTDDHLQDGKFMYCMKPEEAAPIVYGQNPEGGDRIWSIGAQCEYPELAMEIINWLCTPEGYLTMNYGPEDECWYYDEDGGTCFTELGKACSVDVNTAMEDHDGSFQDGSYQINNTTWSLDSKNPDASNNETFNYETWVSNEVDDVTEIEQDWRDYNGVNTINEYFESSGNYTLSPGSSYSQTAKDDDAFKTTWNQVTDAVKNYSWQAIYAESDAEYDSIVAEMISKCEEYGYEECLEWSEHEAERRKSYEDFATGKADSILVP